MSYNLNVPLSSQQISSTTVPIQTNFNVANSNFGIDHVDFTNAAPPGGNGGLHNKVSLLKQAGDPTAATDINILYDKLAGTGKNELFMRRASNEGSTVIQMTLESANPSAAATGVSFLPGGIMIQWGQVAAVANNGTVNFGTVFPNACFVVQVTENSASTPNTVGVNGFSTTAFTFKTNAGGNIPITYIAIGN